MPNVKIFVDDEFYADRREQFRALLGPLRASLCRELSVPAAVCQIAVLPVMGMEGQHSVNVEIQYLGRPDRTRAVMELACNVFRTVVSEAVGAVPAVRAYTLDSDTYFALK